MKNIIDENKISEWKHLILDNPKRLQQEKEVIQKYGALFHPDNLDNLTKEEFKSFLLVRNNKHWEAIHRQGNMITEDMDKLKNGLKILLDENKNIKERLDFLFPPGKQGYIRGLGRAIVTPILLMVYPGKYGVWNSKSEEGLKQLSLFPNFKNKDSFARKYIEINGILNDLAVKYSVSLWQLDEIVGWIALGNPPIPADIPDSVGNAGQEAEENIIEEYKDFGLESHLEDFLIENWERLELSKNYSILEEDGDLVGQQYFTDAGRIDILAKSKDDKEWLIIELKKGKSSDQVIGQILRYMGWVTEHKTKDGETVKGLIIIGGKDDRLKYSLKMTNNIKLMTYEVSFKLSE